MGLKRDLILTLLYSSLIAKDGIAIFFENFSEDFNVQLGLKTIILSIDERKSQEGLMASGNSVKIEE